MKLRTIIIMVVSTLLTYCAAAVLVLIRPEFDLVEGQGLNEGGLMTLIFFILSFLALPVIKYRIHKAYLGVDDELAKGVLDSIKLDVVLIYLVVCGIGLWRKYF